MCDMSSMNSNLDKSSKSNSKSTKGTDVLSASSGFITPASATLFLQSRRSSTKFISITSGNVTAASSALRVSFSRIVTVPSSTGTPTTLNPVSSSITRSSLGLNSRAGKRPERAYPLPEAEPRDNYKKKEAYGHLFLSASRSGTKGLSCAREALPAN